MNAEEEAQPDGSAVARYAALGDPVRLAIVRRLSTDGPLPGAALLADAPGLSRQGLAKHLAVLERAGLAESARVGRDRFWRLRARPLAGAGDYLARLSLTWDARLTELRAQAAEVAPG